MKRLQRNLLLRTKRIVVFFLIFFCSVDINAQNCNPTGVPSEIYYPNSTTTPTVNLGIQYLCGPNTVVYDTATGIGGCRYAYLNNNTVLWLKTGCQISQEFVLKAGATLNIMPGTTPPINIIFESGAIINNPSSVTTLTTMCSNITFPFINCSSGILDKEAITNSIIIYPQPAQNLLNLKLSFNAGGEFKYLAIYNNLGQLIREEKIIFKKDETAINISDLSEGVYSVRLFNDKSESIAKKFVISNK